MATGLTVSGNVRVAIVPPGWRRNRSIPRGWRRADHAAALRISRYIRVASRRYRLSPPLGWRWPRLIGNRLRPLCRDSERRGFPNQLVGPWRGSDSQFTDQDPRLPRIYDKPVFPSGGRAQVGLDGRGARSPSRSNQGAFGLWPTTDKCTNGFAHRHQFSGIYPPRIATVRRREINDNPQFAPPGGDWRTSPRRSTAMARQGIHTDPLLCGAERRVDAGTGGGAKLRLGDAERQKKRRDPG